MNFAALMRTQGLKGAALVYQTFNVIGLTFIRSLESANLVVVASL
jgi:hypothetical protein